jgi:ubiquinone/menaquinone biosynthesis C-methylase UbiE
MNTIKTKKAYKGMAMEGAIARWYNKNTANDLNRHIGMAKQFTGLIPAGGKVLEIAPGPGFFCIQLAKLGNYQITGVDISKSFVEIARENAARAGVQVAFQQGNASELPCKDESFDFIFCQAAFKNFSQPVEAIAEMHRVLKPGGVAVIADMRSDASAAELDQEVENLHVSGVNKWFTRWTFHNMLVKGAYSVKEMKEMAAHTPFGTCRVEVSGIGFMVWLNR